MDKLLGLDEVYEYLVPDQCKRNIRNMGIMGGIIFGVRASNHDTERAAHIW